MLFRVVLVFMFLFRCIYADIDINKGVGPTAFDPQLAFNNQGDALVVWNTGGTTIGGVVQYSLYDKTAKTFKVPVTITGMTSSSQHVAVALNNKGDCLVIWDTVLGHIQYSIYDRVAQMLSPAQTISDTGVYSINPNIVLNDEGDAIAVWFDAEMNIQYSTYHKINRRFENAKTITQSKANSQPQIAMNNQGDAVLVWYDIGKEAIAYTLYDKVGKFKSIWTILNTKGALNQVVVINNEMEAIIAWNTGSEVSLSGLIQYVCYNKESKSFSTTKAVFSDKLEQNTFPQIALNNQGESLLTWCKQTADGKDPIWYAAYDKNSRRFDNPKAVESATAYSTMPQITLNNKGESLIGWVTTMDGKIQYAVHNPSSKIFNKTQSIADVSSNSQCPVIAINDQGEAILVWGVLGNIQYSIYDKMNKKFSVANNLF